MKQRSTRQILLDGVILYARHAGILTRPLIFPLLMQLFGIIAWIALAYESVDLTTMLFPDINPWLLWLIFALANLPGLYLFLNGFWRYLIWVSGLNLAVRELADTGKCEDLRGYDLRIRSRAVDFSLIWSFLFGLLFIPLGLAVMPLVLANNDSSNQWLWLQFSALVWLSAMIVVLIILIYVSLVFQVFAFQPGSAGASLFRSADLVSRARLKTAFIVLLSGLVTQMILPGLLLWISQAVGLETLFAWGSQKGLTYVLQKTPHDWVGLDSLTPVWGIIMRVLTLNPAAFIKAITESVLYSFFSGLLLPLFSSWLSFLYADLFSKKDRECGLPETKPGEPLL